MRGRACQSQRRKRETGPKFDSTRGYAKLSQRKEQEARLRLDSMRGRACQSQRRKREAGLEFDPTRGYAK